MCGIAGFIDANEKHLAREKLAKMLQRIKHRGPDQTKGFVTDNYSAGAVRLAIVDIETGHQPIVSDDAIITFNGEIFNYKELRSKQDSEIETLLKLYLQHGIAMLDKLNGHYAISIYDRRTKVLHLVRDNYGTRPLFFYKLKHGIVYASEIKAIQEYIDESLNLSFDATVEIAKNASVCGDMTAFENVYQVPIGYRVEFADGQIQYIKIEQTVRHTDYSNYSDDDFVAEFREEFNKSVKRQMMSDVTIGCFLSGGLDSSAIMSVLSENMDLNNLKTFSIRFNNSDFDETDFQKDIVDYFNVENIHIDIDDSDILDNLSDALWHAETPVRRTGFIPFFMVAKKIDTKVIFSGEGTDELLLGYDYFNRMKNMQNVIFDKLYDIQNLFSHDSSNDLDSIRNSWIEPVGNLKYVQQRQIHTVLSNYLLNTQADRMLMSSGVETRYPFLDRQFSEYALSLPVSQLIRGRCGKHILRSCFKNKLPDKIVNKTKILFRASGDEILLNSPLLKEYLTEDRLRDQGFFNISEIKNIIDNGAKNSDYKLTLVLSTMMLADRFRNIPKLSDTEIESVVIL